MKIALSRQTKTLLLGAFFILVPLTTKASTLYQQSVHSIEPTYSQTSSSRPSLQGQALHDNTAGMTGTAESFTFYSTDPDWATVFTDNGSTPFNISTCDVAWTFPSDVPTCTGTSASVVNMSPAAFPAGISNSGNYWTVTFPSPITLDPSKYYMVNIIPLYFTGSGYTDHTWSLAGTASGTCRNSFYNYYTGARNACLNGLTEMMWALNGSGGYEIPPVHSSVSALSSPVNQSVSTSTAVTFTFSYTNAGVYSTASVRLDDITAQQSVAMATSSISASGTFTYSQNVTLVDGHYYKATPFIRDTLGKYIYGPSTFFFAVTNNLASFDDLSTTTSTGLFGSAFTLHDTILNKVPFAWIAQIVAIVQANATTSPSGNFPSFNIDIPCAGQTLATFSATNTCQSIALFSTSTIKNAHTSSFIETADLLLALFVYFDGLLVLYALRKQLFH